MEKLQEILAWTIFGIIGLFLIIAIPEALWIMAIFIIIMLLK